MVGINYCLMVGSLVTMKPRESVEILGIWIEVGKH